KASLCAPGFSVCSPEDWNRNHRHAPKNNYWTSASNFKYYTQSGSSSCWADYNSGTQFDQPMHVCAAATDSLGNVCTYTGCIFNQAAPFSQEFGGGNGNSTAGTLCCKTAHSGCASDADCNDSNWCNGAETCNSGVCVAGTPPCGGSTPTCIAST